MGFNTFLPAGYRIEYTDNPEDPIAVYTPHDYSASKTGFNGSLPSMAQLPGLKYRNADSAPVALPPINAIARQVGVGNIGISAGMSNVPVVPVAKAQNIQPTSHQAEAVEEPQPVRPVIHPPEHRAPVEFNQAINYVNKIKVFCYDSRYRIDLLLNPKFIRNFWKFYKPIKRNKSQFKRCFHRITI
jgi:paired amphipathic helix protein Sin3a